MRVICIYRDNEDYTRSVTEFIENVRRQTGHVIESMDPDKNTTFCRTYDIVEYPTIIALDNQGSVLNLWRGRNLPLIDEVLFYMTR